MAVAIAPGSCGELVQGMVDGRYLLVTCPVSWYSEVEVIPGVAGRLPAHQRKLGQAIVRWLTQYGRPTEPFLVRVRSALPRGKGMASSSADIAAACVAIAKAMGQTISAMEIAEIAVAIEPSDGIFFPGIVAFDHVKGLWHTSLGDPPKMTLAVFDTGGRIDTVRFNRRTDLLDLNRQKAEAVARAYALVAQGLALGDPRMIGEGATISALANQCIVEKRGLTDAVRCVTEYGAVGINTAHSGTVIGILFDDHHLDGYSACVRRLLQEHNWHYLGQAKLVSGGIFSQ